MQFSSDERGQLAAIAASINVPELAFLAVVMTESAGIKGTMIGSRLEPQIRYEGHYFDKLCAPGVRDEARRAGVSSPSAGKIKNPKNQVDRWALVKKAAQFDKNAAFMSVSYGIGQVMGANYKKLGYSSIDQFVSVARSGLAGQAKIMANYIKVFGLDDELRALDWSGFARGYNGPATKGYDKDLAKNYASLGGTGSISVERAGYLRLGSKGKQVRELQALLAKTGYTVKVDGDFGSATAKALSQFQIDHRLTSDGKLGPETQEALSAISTSTPNAGVQDLVSNPLVQKAGAVVVAAPTAISYAQDKITDLQGKVSSVSFLSDLLPHINTALTVLTVAAIVAGVTAGVWAWYQSKQTHTGTKPVSSEEGLEL